MSGRGYDAGTRVVVMNGGVLQQADTPQMLCDYPRNLFVAGFVGSPQMNFVDAACKAARRQIVSYGRLSGT